MGDEQVIQFPLLVSQLGTQIMEVIWDACLSYLGHKTAHFYSLMKSLGRIQSFACPSWKASVLVRLTLEANLLFGCMRKK